VSFVLEAPTPSHRLAVRSVAVIKSVHSSASVIMSQENVTVIRVSWAVCVTAVTLATLISLLKDAGK